MATKIIKKVSKPAATEEKKATVSTKTNITNIDDLCVLVRDTYNAKNDKKITKDEVSKVLNAFSESFSTFAKTTDADKATFILPGIGRFSVNEQKERPGVNPKTGAKITIPAKKRVSLKVFPKFSEEINK